MPDSELCNGGESLNECRNVNINRFGHANRRFEFHKRCQLFFRSHNEALSIVAMCVSNLDRSPVASNG
jgi:hypothetical protein